MTQGMLFIIFILVIVMVVLLIFIVSYLKSINNKLKDNEKEKKE